MASVTAGYKTTTDVIFLFLLFFFFFFCKSKNPLWIPSAKTVNFLQIFCKKKGCQADFPKAGGTCKTSVNTLGAH